MKRKYYLFANWKLEKTREEAKEWWEGFLPLARNLRGNLEIVLCPSFPLLPFLMEWKEKKLLQGVKISLGAQDVSRFKRGQYTGEVGAFQLKGMVDYILIGHSERRKNFGEDLEVMKEKGSRCFEASLIPLFCLARPEEGKFLKMERRSFLVAYEPPEAISREGRWQKVDPQKAEKAGQRLKQLLGERVPLLYGGSVNPETAPLFLQGGVFSGFLCGFSSLSPSLFIRLARILLEGGK